MNMNIEYIQFAGLIKMKSLEFSDLMHVSVVFTSSFMEKIHLRTHEIDNEQAKDDNKSAK